MKFMKREEEIINKAIEYGQQTPSEYDDGRYDLSDLEWAFEEGAKWADEHPYKELKEKMMHDICGWLDWHAKDYIGATYGPAPQYESYHLIYDLKEYIEELENGKA